MTYIPAAYWQAAGRAYDPPACHQQLDLITRWYGDLRPTSLLEVGPGWGRVYALLKDRGLDVGGYVMCDFVESMRRNCQKATGILPDSWDGATLPYRDASFDLVLSAWVLLHVPPHDVAQVFSEHIRVAKRWLLVISMERKAKRRPLAAHCFLHDYPALFDILVARNEQGFASGDRAWLLEKP